MPTRSARFVPMLLVLSSACSEPFEAETGDAQASMVDTGSRDDRSTRPTEAGNERGDERADEAGRIEAGRDAATPPPIADGLLLWLRADAGVDQSSAGLVSAWADQSGHHLDARQPDATKQPK